jgi:hypothetical protein
MPHACHCSDAFEAYACQRRGRRMLADLTAPSLQTYLIVVVCDFAASPERISCLSSRPRGNCCAGADGSSRDAGPARRCRDAGGERPGCEQRVSRLPVPPGARGRRCERAASGVIRNLRLTTDGGQAGAPRGYHGHPQANLPIVRCGGPAGTGGRIESSRFALRGRGGSKTRWRVRSWLAAAYRRYPLAPIRPRQHPHNY